MKLFTICAKTLRELFRDLSMLILALSFGPVFVLLYWLFFPSGSTMYQVTILNQDTGYTNSAGTLTQTGNDLIAAFGKVTYPNGSPLFRVTQVDDRSTAEKRLKNRDTQLLLIIPADFSQTIATATMGKTTNASPVTLVGDLTNPYYIISATLASATLTDYVTLVTGQGSPVSVVEEALGDSAARTEFENYIPGLFIFSILLSIFLAAMTVTREVECGGLRRLQLTRVTSFDYLGGVSAALLLIGLAQMGVTFLTALALGFHSQGSLFAALLVGILTMFSVIGVGLLVACVSRTVNRAFIIANFPLALMMFFSGSIFPIPPVVLFTVGSRNISLFDILPPTHAVTALNKIFTMGASLGDITYELIALFVLSLLYFVSGVLLFQRTQMTAH